MMSLLRLSATFAALLCLDALSLTSASPVPNPQGPTSANTSAGSPQASPTTTSAAGVPVVLPWFPAAGPQAPIVVPGQYQILGEGGTETTLYYSGPGYSPAGVSLVPVTDVVQEIIIVHPSGFDAYNIAGDAAVAIDCSLASDNRDRASCVARGRASANAAPIVQTASNIAGVPTTIYAQPTTLAGPLQLPDLGGGAERVNLRSGVSLALAGIAAFALA